MNQTADLTEKTLSREEKYQGSFLSLHVDQVQLPNGRTSFREVVEHVDGVAILALDDRNNVLTVTQYRYVIGKTLLEIPAGKLEPGEDPVAGALRELKEETGAVPDTFLPMGVTLPSPGCLSERLYLFLAKGLHMESQQLDEDEFLNGPPRHGRGDRGQQDHRRRAEGKSASESLRGDSAMSDPKTVLIVEDEKNIVDILRFNLQRAGYQTLEAYDGEDGLAQAVSANPDLILLDVMLPKKNGFDVCRALRDQGSSVPVIILTAREEEADKVLGLEIGADDYITKPFSMRELVARVGANIRRTTMTPPAAASAAASAMPVSGDLSINTDSHQVFRAGKAIDLTQREYELLTFLASHPNKVYSRIDLMEQVWNYGYVGDDVRTVDVTVRRLREKIEADPANPVFILTRRGAGYYFSVK